MKTKLLTLSTILICPFSFGASLGDSDLMGVYALTKFVTVSQDGSETPWCQGAQGTIAYVPGYMGVAINCESTSPHSNAAELDGKLFYSGPFEIDTETGEVLHRVRNYSHLSLNRVQRRKVSMPDRNHLSLSGDIGKGQRIVIEWKRQESFAYNNDSLPGFYELVGSENEVTGSSQTIPFCSGFHGSILYTPGGYGAVSINCGEKTDPSVTEPADAFDRSYFYAGPYKQIKNILVQKIELASVADQIGNEAEREMTIDGDLLILKGTNGSKFVAKWKKLRSFVGLKKNAP